MRTEPVRPLSGDRLATGEGFSSLDRPELHSYVVLASDTPHRQPSRPNRVEIQPQVDRWVPSSIVNANDCFLGGQAAATDDQLSGRSLCNIARDASSCCCEASSCFSATPCAILVAIAWAATVPMPTPRTIHASGVHWLSKRSTLGT